MEQVRWTIAQIEMLSSEEQKRYHEVRNRSDIDDEHLKLLLAFLLRTNSNCIDVGASLGSFMDCYLRLAPEGHHIAFEPIADLCDRLRTGWPQIDVRCVALSDENGEADFVHVPDSSYWSSFRRQDYPFPMETRDIKVPTVRLDDSLPAGYRPDFIKIDVEGAELLVLRGAVRTIATSQPLIVFEYGRAASNFGTTSADIYELLVHECGLRIFDLDGNGPYSLVRLEESCATDVRWNYVAHP